MFVVVSIIVVAVILVIRVAAVVVVTVVAVVVVVRGTCAGVGAAVDLDVDAIAAAGLYAVQLLSPSLYFSYRS